MIKQHIDVCLSPMMLPLYDLQGKVVVVIDILRATTTICTALANGAEKVIPVLDMEASLKFKNKGYIIAAERQGQKVEGFAFGNSPFEYTAEKIKGKTIVLTTTNGTRAIELSRAAEQITAGSFLNIEAICEYLKKQNIPILLLCAGWKNNFNLEDTIFAGAVVHYLRNSFLVTTDSSLAAEYLYLNTRDDVISHMKKASHYRRLHELGIDQDVEYCFTGKALDVVPVLKDDALVAV